MACMPFSNFNRWLLLLELSLIRLLFFFIAMTSCSLSDRPGSQPRVQGTVIACNKECVDNADSANVLLGASGDGH